MSDLQETSLSLIVRYVLFQIITFPVTIFVFKKTNQTMFEKEPHFSLNATLTILDFCNVRIFDRPKTYTYYNSK